MIQQQTKLCLGTMKRVQWPTLVRGASKVLWPLYLKGQTPILPYSCSSTMAQVQSPMADGTSPNVKNKTTASITPLKQNQGEKTEESKFAQMGKEMDAVLKVQSLSSALEACSDFNSQQRLEVLKNLATAGIRPLPLIQTLTEGIAKSTHDLNMKELSNLLFLLGKLSYTNEDLLSRTCEAIKSQLKQTTNAAVVGSSISSLRNLQWKEPDLLNEFGLWVQHNFYKFQNPSAFIYTLALQNHSPPNLEELLELVWNDISKRTYSSADLINLVWSIHVLNCPFHQEKTKNALNSFFNSKFLAGLGSGPLQVPVWMKLLNLHSIAKSSWGQVDFKIPEDMKTKISAFKQRNDKKNMLSEVSQLLFKDLDTNLYSLNVPSHMGFSIDMVFSLDEKNNAIPTHLASPKSTRIAIMLHSYHECCQPTKEPNGFRTFEMRLLEDDFTVVSVPYYLLGGGSAQVHEYFESVLKSIARKHN